MLQNFALCPELIAQGRLVAASTRAPKLVCLFFDLLLHKQVVIHREKRRFLHWGLHSLLHFAFPWPGFVKLLRLLLQQL